MLLLALDTATELASLALLEGESLLGEYALESPGTYLERLLPAIEELLGAAGRTMDEVEAIAVSQGPGNFTGLRIGVATAKALAWAQQRPLVAVSTLEVLAAQIPFQPHPIAVLVDAKRNEVFFGLFLCPQDLPQGLDGPRRLPVAALPPLLTPPLVLTGPGLNRYGDFLKEHLPPSILWAPPEMRHPRAGTLARLARRFLSEGRESAPESLAPTYLRPAL